VAKPPGTGMTCHGARERNVLAGLKDEYPKAVVGTRQVQGQMLLLCEHFLGSTPSWTYPGRFEGRTWSPRTIGSLRSVQ